MSPWRASFLAVILCGALCAQTAAQLESDSVKRVGAHIQCTCGCKSTVACEMPGGCAYCKRMRTEIWQLQAQGKSDGQIIAQIVSENGPGTYLASPSKAASVIPYVALAFGFGVIYWFVRRQLTRPAAASSEASAVPPINPADLERYNDRIEQDLKKLE